MLLSLDTETSGVDFAHGVQPFLITTCQDNNEQLYWEWDVNPLTRRTEVVREDVYELVKLLDQAEEIVFQHGKFDIRALESIGLKWKKAWWHKVHDTLFSGHLLASSEPHDLTAQAVKYLGIDIEPYELELHKCVLECRKLIKREFPTWRYAKEGDPMLPSTKGEKVWKNDYWTPRAVAVAKKLPKDHKYWTALSSYANIDSSVTLEIRKVHKKLMEERGLTKIYDSRRKLIKVIHEMECNGVTFSMKRWNELMPKFQKEELASEKVCIGLSGGKLDRLPKNGSSKALHEVIFKRFKLPEVKVKKKNKKTDTPSINKQAIATWLATLDPKSSAFVFIKNLKKNRGYNTAIGYSESYKKFGIRFQTSDFYKLHPSFNATGSDTLRFSCSNPNGQNISKLSDANLRYMFGPRLGREWWSLDYCNLELVLPAYECNEEEMIQLFERPNDPPYFGSQHLLIAHILHPKEFEECLAKGLDFKKVYKDTLYQWTKNGDFAVTYGAIEESGTADTAYHMKGAQRLIKQRLKKLTDLNNYYVDYAKKHGIVYTMFDKDIGGAYPIMAARDEWGRIKPTAALNYHVQGSAMWAMCKAMIRVNDYLNSLNNGSFITLQVHDELVLDLPVAKPGTSNEPVIMNVKRLMEQSGDDLGVPLRTSVSYHPNNWSKEEEYKAAA